MKTFFRDIFEYHHYANRLLGDQLREHENLLPDNLVNLYSHIMNAHAIWNSRIIPGTAPAVFDVHSAVRCMKMNEENYHATLKILDREDLNRKVGYLTSKGQEYTNSVQEILFHVANHSTHHRGQIIAEIRRNNLEPVITDYIFFRR